MEYNLFKKEMISQLQGLQIELNEEQINSFYSFMNMLIEKNKIMNLTGIIDPKEIIIKHFLDSLTIAKFLKNNKKIMDLGTGAGFPGIPIKIHNSTLDLCLLDSLNKRIGFLNGVISNLKLEKIETIHGRAEDFGKDINYREKYDVVVSRAVAPLNTLLEYMLPFTRINGQCICMKGNITPEELKDSENALKILGGEIETIDRFFLNKNENARSIILVKKTKNTPNQYPRNAGTPAKKPL